MDSQNGTNSGEAQTQNQQLTDGPPFSCRVGADFTTVLSSRAKTSVRVEGSAVCCRATSVLWSCTTMVYIDDSMTTAKQAAKQVRRSVTLPREIAKQVETISKQR